MFLALQQVQVDAVIDRDRVMLGELVTLTITVEATSNEPVQILNPSTVGLEILGTTDQSDVSIREGVAMRILTRTLRLRATAAGPGRIGATTVRSGESIAQTDAIDVTVVADDEASESTLAPHIRDMVARHRPTRASPDAVFVEVLTSTQSLMLGEQLDLAVVAWFPQQIRAQLRTPPTLQPPEFQGAWTYSHGVPHAVDMRREIGGTLYQVYVHSVVVFPLTPGNLEIGPATVSYSLPMSYSFLSREVRHEPQSDSARVQVMEQPENGRPAFFEGAAGTGLEIAIEANPPQLAVGDASVVTATITGEGNVALWPEPRIRWPEGIRAYPEGVEVSLVPDAARITGSKTFRYLVVPDSSGTHLINELSYAYYELETRRYVVLRSPELPIVAELTSTAPSSPVIPDARPLMRTGSGISVTHLVESLPAWVLILVLTLPAVTAAAFIVIPELQSLRGTKSRISERAFDRLEHELRYVLCELVGDTEQAAGIELASALRAAGVDTPIAAHAARVRERLWQANYGPESEPDPDELTAEVNELLKALGGAAVGVALVLFCVLAPVSALSAQSSERLFEAGAFRTAADSFAARAEAEPWITAHWYNLGVTWERVGEVERARRAWIRAARLSPRDGRVRTALQQLPLQDITSNRMAPVSPFTPAEILVAAFCVWILAWVGVSLRFRKSVTMPVVILAILIGAYGIRMKVEYEVQVAFVLNPDIPLRAAPYGPANPRQFLAEGSAVKVTRIEGPWMLVERGIDKGWLLRDEVVTLQ